MEEFSIKGRKDQSKQTSSVSKDDGGSTPMMRKQKEGWIINIKLSEAFPSSSKGSTQRPSTPSKDIGDLRLEVKGRGIKVSL
jgi:hypothetical protein